MNSKDYQKAVTRTIPVSKTQNEINGMLCMGLTGEAGETSELFKKHIYHGHVLDISKVKEELGDTLWYLTNLALHNNLTLEEIMEANIEKTLRRYPKGFNKTDSINRK